MRQRGASEGSVGVDIWGIEFFGKQKNVNLFFHLKNPYYLYIV